MLFDEQMSQLHKHAKDGKLQFSNYSFPQSKDLLDDSGIVSKNCDSQYRLRLHCSWWEIMQIKYFCLVKAGCLKHCIALLNFSLKKFA